MNCLFEHVQLILVEFLIDIGHQEAWLLDDFYGTRYSRFAVLTELDWTKSSTSNLFLQLVVSHKSFNLLKSTLLFKGKKVVRLSLPLCICQTSLRLNQFLCNYVALSLTIGITWTMCIHRCYWKFCRFESLINLFRVLGMMLLFVANTSHLNIMFWFVCLF